MKRVERTILFDSGSLRCKVFMSTNLVAFLLLHRWRNGVSLPQLVESFRQLTNELFSRKSDVGFSGSATVEMCGVRILGRVSKVFYYSHSAEY